MADKTEISWCDSTWNPTTGCDKVSPGCDNCYAMSLAPRLQAMERANGRVETGHYQTDGDPRTSGPGFGIAMHADALDKPLRWTRPRRIFVNSMSDLFHSGVPRVFQAQVFAVMAAAPQHTFQVLTKRPGVMRSVLSSPRWAELLAGQAVWPRDLDPEQPIPNVHLGTSVEDQDHTFRIDALTKTPAAVRFLSMEPLLGPVDLGRWTAPHDAECLFADPPWCTCGRDEAGYIDWVIVGGESGRGARPMHPDWARTLRDQCQASGVAFHFKQWGEWVTEDQSPMDIVLPATSWNHLGDGEPSVWKVGKKSAGRMLDGRTWDEFPEVANA